MIYGEKDSNMIFLLLSKGTPLSSCF